MFSADSSRFAGLNHSDDLEAERQEPRCNLADNFLHLCVRGLKFGAPLQSVREDFRLTGISKMSAIEIVIGGAGGRVEAVGRLDDIIGAPQFLYAFFFNDTATTEIYTLSLHDALPIFQQLFDLTGRVAIVTGGSRGLGL